MAVYMFVCMPILLTALFSYKRKVTPELLLFLLLPLFLLSAMRYDIGRDYDSYMIIFNHPELMQVHEKGYMLINNFAIQHDLTLQFVIILYALLTLIFAYLFIFENSKNKILSLLIFYAYTPFYLQTLNTLRQGLAIYIFMYATRFIRKKQFVKYCILIVSAAFFAHNSVVVTIPLYFLLNRNYKPVMKLIMIGTSVIVSGLLEIVVKATPYAVYLLGGDGEGSFAPIFLLDVSLCGAIVCLYKNKSKCIFYNLTLLSLCILCMGIVLKSSPIFTVVSRINEFFLPSLLITIPSFVQNSRKYRQIFYYFCLFCFLGVFYFSITLNGVMNQLVPYKTFFGVFHNDLFIDDILIFWGSAFFVGILQSYNNLKRRDYV
ncbi:MAG: EpsG family protein [Treponema sp.]|nr:EpsG family protein [Treponema sp.]